MRVGEEGEEGMLTHSLLECVSDSCFMEHGTVQHKHNILMNYIYYYTTLSEYAMSHQSNGI